MSHLPEVMNLNFPAVIEEEFPRQFGPAWLAVEEVLEAVRGADFHNLERRSPALKGFDWGNYLRCSVVRVVRAASVLQATGLVRGRLLDFGSYFGNFSLAFAKSGYQVDSVDSYSAYGDALSGVAGLLGRSGISVLDFMETGYGLEYLEPASYDAVLCMGVIEHMPHSPRPALEAVNRVLKPGGYLVMDTPNLAYLYNRQKMSRGESIFCPISFQFDTEFPFEGHHREYTIQEVAWMLERMGHEEISVSTFNYSIYGISVVQGADLENYRVMMADPTCREVIMTISRKNYIYPPDIASGEPT